MDATQQEACCATPGDVVTGNVEPLLHEIRHALLRWLEEGEVTTIDLRSIPMGPGEEEKIVDELGRGEIQVRMLALGPSEIIETRFPGVWLVTHYNSNEEIIGKFVEVCDMPELLKAQEGDIREGIEFLNTQLA